MALVLALIGLLSFAQSDQTHVGELRIAVTDATGLPLQCDVDLISQANQFQEHLQTDQQGTLAAKRLPFGTYQVVVTRSGFSPFSQLVHVQSALPSDVRVTLMVASVDTRITVTADDTLMDPNRTSTVNRIGASAVAQRLSSLPGRSVPDLVDTQPGWLMEANGVLHPRGSEYQVQYVFDGLPVTDNRSVAFAPGLDADNVHSMSILTGGYPAEYGRKLGGVVEVTTAGQAREGFHGTFALSGGSFATAGASGMGEYGWARSTLSVNGDAARTDRYLDPPVEENFSNSGRVSNVAVHFEHDFSSADRLGVVIRRSGSSFAVPNERVQEEAGQDQRRQNHETLAQFSYQHVFSSTMLADIRAMTRTLSAGLSSNASATPIQADGDRGLHETYLKATITKHSDRHEWKLGGEASFGRVRERFSYLLADRDAFEPSTPASFAFAATRPDREQALFVQDQMRFAALTINAGVRWDHYSLLVDEQAVSPRFAVAWAVPSASDLTIRASYDRVFQTPAVENLLLASSAEVDQLNADVVRLPVRPSRGNFFEIGGSKRLFGKMRLDATHYWRDVSNFADDDVLLNTGVTFPIAFAEAHISGTEVKLDTPLWRGFSGFVSYAYMRGLGTLPITGGLLLGAEAADALGSNDEFAITQDQRHSWRARLSYQVRPRIWLAFETSYGSGLPVEFSGDPDQALAQYGPRILDRVDFDEGRVKPNLSLDASAGVELTRTNRRSLRLQADVTNLLNRLNLINFAGLFSGTAIGPPRSFSVRLSYGF